jgi:putative oxidoreductase
MEVLGSIGLLVPRLTGFAASAAAALLVGATITNVAVLHTCPALPLPFFAAAAVIAYTRRADLIDTIMRLRV